MKKTQGTKERCQNHSFLFFSNTLLINMSTFFEWCEQIEGFDQVPNRISFELVKSLSSRLATDLKRPGHQTDPSASTVHLRLSPNFELEGRLTRHLVQTKRAEPDLSNAPYAGAQMIYGESSPAQSRFDLDPRPENVFPRLDDFKRVESWMDKHVLGQSFQNPLDPKQEPTKVTKHTILQHRWQYQPNDGLRRRMPEIEYYTGEEVKQEEKTKDRAPILCYSDKGSWAEIEKKQLASRIYILTKVPEHPHSQWDMTLHAALEMRKQIASLPAAMTYMTQHWDRSLESKLEEDLLLAIRSESASSLHAKRQRFISVSGRPDPSTTHIKSRRKGPILQYGGVGALFKLEVAIVTTEWDNLPCHYSSDHRRTEKEDRQHFMERGVDRHTEIEVELDMDVLWKTLGTKEHSKSKEVVLTQQNQVETIVRGLLLWLCVANELLSVPTAH